VDVLGIVGLVIGIVGIPLSFLLSRYSNSEAQIAYEQVQRHIDDVEVVILSRLDRLDEADRQILADLGSIRGPNV
jgi:hypothetical protein